MRILHLLHYFPPETPGGTQEYVAQLAQLQLCAGHAPGVIAGARRHAPGGALEECRQEGLPVWRLVRDLEREALSGDLGSARLGQELERLALRFAPDVVHVHHWHALTRDVVRRLGARGLPVVLTLHDLFVTCPRFFRMPDHERFCAGGTTLLDCADCLAPEVAGLDRPRLVALLEERRRELFAELGAAARVLAVSQAQAELLRALPGFPRVALEVEPIGIRCDVPPPAPPAPLAGRLRLVNWAGLDRRKGLHVLIEALAGSAQRAGFELHLYGREGDPEYVRELRERARDLALHLHGPFADAERFRFAGRYDLAVFPFLAFETHALVVDEALRSGIPVLVSDRGAPRARLGGRGLAVAPEVGPLRAALEQLLREPARLARMRAAAPATRDLGEHARALERRYAELVEARTPGR